MNDTNETYGADRVALHLLGATQAAALACVPWVGRGDKEGADGAAVAAMRKVLDTVPGRGRVVIGEGEKDDAPMLYTGEEVGNGDGPAFELAIDPLEGTDYCASGLDGAIAVLAAGPPDSIWATSGYYMDKLIVGSAAKGTIDIDAPVDDNLDRVANALGKEVRDLVVVVLDKPRHEDLIERIYAAGASIVLIPEGDVFGALRVMLPDTRADALFGVGGAPEGVITAAFVRLLGGDMQASLAPQSDEEREKLADAGQEPGRPLQLDDLVSNAECCFVATSVTAGQILRGPTRTEAGWRTQSFVSTPTQRRLVVEAVHLGRDLSETPQGD